MRPLKIFLAGLLAGGLLIAHIDATPQQPQSQQPPGASGASAAPKRPKITGISHVAFRVSAMSAAQAFYRDVLGLQLIGVDAVWGREYFRVSHRQQIVLEPRLRPGEDERLSHLAFETESLDAMTAYLKSQGLETSADPPKPMWHCAQDAVWVTDPDGHPIEFVLRRESMVASGFTNPPGVDPISSRILHAGLTIRDADAADRFYKTTLGFSEIWRGGRTDDVVSWINMKVPDGTDYLEYMLAPGPGPLTRQQLGSMHHVALLVPDIQAAYETAQRRTPDAARASMASPQVGRNRRWQLNLFDPDGTRTELMEPFTMR